MNTPPPLMRTNDFRSDYQVPPPPRPIERVDKQPIKVNKYDKIHRDTAHPMDRTQRKDSKNENSNSRQMRLPSLGVITSTLRLRSKERGDSLTRFEGFLSQNRDNTDDKSPPRNKIDLEEKSPDYQVIHSPPHQKLPMPQKDPYGTMRASRRIGGAKAAGADVEEFFENPKKNTLDTNGCGLEDDDDDVFTKPKVSKIDKIHHSSLTTVPNDPSDPFGTLRANKAINNRVTKSLIEREEETRQKQPLKMAVISNKEKHLIDYRGIPASNQDSSGTAGAISSGISEDLVITDELLQLLEDFKTNSYSMKEMEMLFENWRRKAAIYETSGSDKDEVLSKVRNTLIVTNKYEHMLFLPRIYSRNIIFVFLLDIAVIDSKR